MPGKETRPRLREARSPIAAALCPTYGPGLTDINRHRESSGPSSRRRAGLHDGASIERDRFMEGGAARGRAVVAGADGYISAVT
jgi:hypothetical protein